MDGAVTVLLGGTFSHVVICMDFSGFCKVPPRDKSFSESAPLADTISVSQSSCTVPGQCSDIIYSQKTVRKRGWYVTNGMSFSTAIVYSLGLLLYLLL